jgi:hypothetical protein
MPKQAESEENGAPRAETPAVGAGLPPHLLARVNPKILESRRKKIAASLSNGPAQADCRRRYLNTLVEHHLAKELKSA